MAATAAPTAHPAPPQDLKATAAALWTFVHLKVPRFTSEAALKVIEGLQPQPDEDPKVLAKRLRKALSDTGVALKHTAALNAASRILGRSESSAGVRPARTNSTICCLNSAGYGGRTFDIYDSLDTKNDVSTEPGQLQSPVASDADLSRIPTGA